MVALRNAKAPSRLYGLLTAREAELRHGVGYRQLYAWAAADLLHPVQPNGRILYPEWELEALTNAGYEPRQQAA